MCHCSPESRASGDAARNNLKPRLENVPNGPSPGRGEPVPWERIEIGKRIWVRVRIRVRVAAREQRFDVHNAVFTILKVPAVRRGSAA